MPSHHSCGSGPLFLWVFLFVAYHAQRLVFTLVLKVRQYFNISRVTIADFVIQILLISITFRKAKIKQLLSLIFACFIFNLYLFVFCSLDLPFFTFSSKSSFIGVEVSISDCGFCGPFPLTLPFLS